MARRLKVFVVSLLLACLFCSPVYAEFSSSDSSNLSNIRTDVSTIRSYISNLSDLGLIKSYLNSISSNFISYFDPSRYGSFSYQNLSKLDIISSKLESILNVLGASSYKVDDRNAVYAFDSRYCLTTQESTTYPGMILGSADYIFFNPTQYPYYVYFLPAGSYVLELSVTSSASLAWFGLETNYNLTSNPDAEESLYLTDFEFAGTLQGITRYRCYFDVSFPNGLTFGSAFIKFQSSVDAWGCAYIYRVEGAEGIVSDSLSPSVDSHGQQLDQGVNQMEDLENTAFDSLDTSIGSLDFSGSALGQVVSGFTFIRAVFSAVYSSSPYISVLINLSCMLGVLALFLRVQPRFTRWEREHRDRTS